MSVKHDLLTALEKNRGTAISGQMIADSLGVSRNAVWKAIHALTDEGYHIISTTNKGYQLADDCDVLSAEGVGAYLAPNYRDILVYAYKEIDSTNNEAKRLLADGLEGKALVISESQSKGRGRQGRAFYSPSFTGAYMSLIIHPDFLAKTIPITTMAAVAVTEVIEKLTDRQLKIKWVNDIYLDGKKICGILTEATTDFETGAIENIIVGIGININTVDFPPDIKKVAGSLASEGINRNEVIAQIVNRLLDLISDADNNDYLESYRRHSMVIEEQILYYVKGQEYTGKAIGIDDEGGLIIEKADGSQTVLNSGEISLRLA